MIRMSELLKLKCTENFKILAGENGLRKEVSGLGILEYETNENMKVLFSKGDLILTTLFFAKNDKTFAEESIINLMDNVQISGLAIKTIFYDDFSQNVKDHANKRAIPLFVFKDTFFEDIIVSISEMIKSNKNNKRLEENVNRIIKHEVGKTSVKEVAKEINNAFYNNIICAYCMKKDYRDDGNILKILDILRLSRNKYLNKISTSIFKYENGILIIYSFENEKKPLTKDELIETIETLMIKTDEFYIGVSDIHHNINELDICIKKSIYASQSCKNNGIPCCDFKNTGIDKILIPLKNNYWISLFYKEIIEAIIKYDNEYNSELLATAIAYIENKGKIGETGKVMFQHRNTIRYRLENIKEILGSTEKEDDFYEQLYFAVKSYLLSNKK